MKFYKEWGERPGDFEPKTPEEWHNVTAVGDDWEVEMNIYGDSNLRGTWRHRRVSFNGRSTDWTYGRPPSGFYAKKAEGDGEPC